MISLEALDALDLLEWLGSGAAAAQRLQCSQSTVSRQAREVLRSLDLVSGRRLQPTELQASSPLLAMERQLHQLYRLRQGRKLRLDASFLAAPLVRPGGPPGWMRGHLLLLGRARPLRLLQERVLDAWLCGMGDELGDIDRSRFWTLDLLETPLQLLAPRHHPLALAGPLQAADLVGVPRQAPPAGLYPRSEAILQRDLRSQPSLRLRDDHYLHPPAAQPSPLTLRYGSCLSLGLQAGLVPLQIRLPVCSRVTLVVLRDLLEQPAMAALIHWLMQRCQLLAGQHPDLIGLAG